MKKTVCKQAPEREIGTGCRADREKRTVKQDPLIEQVTQLEGTVALRRVDVGVEKHVVFARLSRGGRIIIAMELLFHPR